VILRYVTLKIQQDRLRVCVERASGVFNRYNITYWWDFGTLLGIVREKDIIWTETDSDISIMISDRNKLWFDYDIRQELHNEGFIIITMRDEYKLRIYESWGWYLDMDVWNDSNTHLQMITGRRDPEIYHLPKHMILPVAHVQLESMNNVPLAIPAKSDSILAHWYGKDYMIPKKYFKGVDASADKFETFLWAYAAFIYEVLWSFKIIGRVSYWCWFYHSSVVFVFGLFGSMIVVCCILYQIRTKRQSLRRKMMFK